MRRQNENFPGENRRPQHPAREGESRLDYERGFSPDAMTDIDSDVQDRSNSQFSTQGSYGRYGTSPQSSMGERHWGQGEYKERRLQEDKSVFERMGEKVGEFFGKGPKNYTRSDERVREDSCECLWRHSHIDATDVDVACRDGVVTLTGTVPDRRMKSMIEDEIKHIPGVRDVINEIRI